ncbi:MAG: hypothetical protein NT090_04290, partial [Acidobacteria bacterium]|nr:hypothetical protein [Acidobacteriota bacterium]
QASPAPQPAPAPAPAAAAIPEEGIQKAAAATPGEGIQQAAAATPEEAIQKAAGSLIEAGIHFLESLVPRGEPQPSAEAAGSPIARALSNVFQKDPRTNRPMLAIPLPESVTQERLAGALAGLLNSLAGRT